MDQCGSVFTAMEWNNATRRRIEPGRNFVPIQKVFDDKDNLLNKKLKWFCLNCSIEKPDVIVKLVEESLEK